MNLTQFEKDSPEDFIHYSYKILFRKWDDEGDNFEIESDDITIENEHSDDHIKKMAARELKIEIEDLIEIIKLNV